MNLPVYDFVNSLARRVRLVADVLSDFAETHRPRPPFQRRIDALEALPADVALDASDVASLVRWQDQLLVATLRWPSDLRAAAQGIAAESLAWRGVAYGPRWWTSTVEELWLLEQRLPSRIAAAPSSAEALLNIICSAAFRSPAQAQTNAAHQNLQVQR